MQYWIMVEKSWTKKIRLPGNSFRLDTTTDRNFIDRDTENLDDLLDDVQKMNIGKNCEWKVTWNNFNTATLKQNGDNNTVTIVVAFNNRLERDQFIDFLELHTKSEGGMQYILFTYW